MRSRCQPGLSRCAQQNHLCARWDFTDDIVARLAGIAG
jgi:hypothetical protein